ncbi:YidB family protein [Rahnella bruchi]|uniref:YidB family protein n=1 Tax=Rahnella bruchi TaxID=1510573 RepID=UPI000EA0A9D1|nr:YidB family protein [Rahnella bruchi]
MSIMDKISGLISGQKSKNNEIEAVLSWFESQNGISNILDKMKEHGLGFIVESWLSDKENLTVLPEQVLSFVDTPALEQLAKKCGIDLHSAASMLARYLPSLADGLSHSGSLSSAGTENFLSAGMSILKNKFTA